MPPAAKKKSKKPKKAKEAKPPKEELLRHQAVKELMRCAKGAKTLRALKLARKCKTLRDDESNEKKHNIALEQLQQTKKFSTDTFQPLAHELIYGELENPLKNLKSWDAFQGLSEEDQLIVREILQQKSFQEMLAEQNKKIADAQIPYKSKRQRQIEESALRKEVEGDTVRQKHKQNIGIFIESLEDATVTDVMPIVRKETGKNKGTKGVPRHLRESHVEERKRQRQPDLSAYGPASAAAEFEPKVSHGNRADFGEGNANKKYKTDAKDEKSSKKQEAVSNSAWKKTGVHPSWEAKQKMKTQSALIGTISLSTKSGNKITFSDD